MHYINPKSNFLEEINQLKYKLDQLQSPIVFAHNDLLLGNVIYNCDKNCVTFIDYEYAHMNYQAFDIGNHFAEFQGKDSYNIFTYEYIYIYTYYLLFSFLLITRINMSTNFLSLLFEKAFSNIYSNES